MPPMIELRGVRVHNLRQIDVDIPRQKLTVICGVSGAGKSSLAFDTMYAEGQRRYVQSFSTYARQFLERLEPPDADRIGDLPPPVAIRPTSVRHGPRSTVGTLTEVLDDLRLLFARLGQVVCPDCQVEVRSETPASAAAALQQLPAGTRIQLAFDWPVPANPAEILSLLKHAGFTRAIVGDQTVSLGGNLPATVLLEVAKSPTIRVVLDRLTAGKVEPARLLESLEAAFASGTGECVALIESAEADGTTHRIDARNWRILQFSSDHRCPGCRRAFSTPEPRLFNFATALGACPRCQGLGVVPISSLETSSAACGGPGSSKPLSDGLRSKVRSQKLLRCPACLGARLRPEALAVILGFGNIAAWSAQTVDQFLTTLETHLANLPDNRELAAEVFLRMTARGRSIQQLGLGHLTLDRPAASLSSGELRRVQLTAALGSQLVNTLFVLDEPSAGLHPRDTENLVAALVSLRDAGNTVVVVEHNPVVMRRADWLVDLGPGGGPDGGRVLYQGPPRAHNTESPTHAALFEITGEDAHASPCKEPRPARSWLTLTGIEYLTLHSRTVALPLGILCVVTGVSGAGKTTLVRDVLVPAIQRSISGRTGTALDLLRYADLESPQQIGRLSGCEALDEVVFIDQRPLPRHARSTPASLSGILSGLRVLFAQTPDAQVRNYSPLHFSLQSNSPGCCPTCRGLGRLDVDMQFLPDLHLPCPDCRGARYRPEVLEIRCRGLSVAEVLALSVRDAFGYLRGLPRLQKRLKAIKDVGLEYLSLGQPATTLSDGELQRLKLATHLGRTARRRTLFVLDEPTIGLHPADVARLVDVLDLLVDSGHSLIVAEHHPQVLAAADWRIEL